jgi:phage-related protein
MERHSIKKDNITNTIKNGMYDAIDIDYHTRPVRKANHQPKKTIPKASNKNEYVTNLPLLKIGSGRLLIRGGSLTIFIS